MTKRADCLFEIHTEELPPKAQINLSTALQQLVTERFSKENLDFGKVKIFATPRRLAILIAELADSQPDQIVERKGPALNVAFDKAGVASKACEGFARSCGVTPQDLLTIKTEQGDWVGFRQAVKGKLTTELLPVMMQQIAAALPVAKRMHWGSGTVEFVRPVHSIILMYGKKVVAAEIMGCTAGNITHGHRFMAEEKIKITAPADYESLLETQGSVIADFNRRRDMVRTEANNCVEKSVGKKGKVQITDALLDEVTGLVEFPVAHCGQFDADFLKVPKEVLISAMQDHQRYFPVVDGNGALLPYFVATSNIKSKNPEQVIHGNERVLRARLSDAKFFFDTDQHESLHARLPRLKEIVYQAKLGSLYDKAERLSKLTAFISQKMGLNKLHAEQAGLLAKADLITNMVGEFPELQGVMGGYYARHDGENTEVAVAICEQYLPRFAGDALPATKLGCALALADRLDLIAGSFVIDQVPTGDKDPYGLRRAALGVVRILVDEKIDLDLKEVVELAVSANLKLMNVACVVDAGNEKGAVVDRVDVAPKILNFIRERMRAWYQEQGVTPDVFAAVAALDVSNLLDFHKRIHAVQSFKKLQEAEALAAANKRVSNILQKYTEVMLSHAVNPAHFEEEAEKELARQLELKSGEINRLTQSGQYDDVLLQLASLRVPVDAFFDKVMVMTEDRPRRENRILLLTRLRNMFLQVADIALLQ